MVLTLNATNYKIDCPKWIEIILETNLEMNPYKWVAPIIWNGKINGDEFYFIQIDEEADDDCCFDFSMLDSKFKIFIPAIVEAIFDIQSCMD